MQNGAVRVCPALRPYLLHLRFLPPRTQGSNLFWFEGQGAPKPRGLVALEGAVVSCRTVVNRTGEKPHALTIELSPDALESSSRQHLTIAAISEELQVGLWVRASAKKTCTGDRHCV